MPEWGMSSINTSGLQGPQYPTSLHKDALQNLDISVELNKSFGSSRVSVSSTCMCTLVLCLGHCQKYYRCIAHNPKSWRRRYGRVAVSFHQYDFNLCLHWSPTSLWSIVELHLSHSNNYCVLPNGKCCKTHSGVSFGRTLLNQREEHGFWINCIRLERGKWPLTACQNRNALW